jgi:hypothetical protein
MPPKAWNMKNMKNSKARRDFVLIRYFFPSHRGGRAKVRAHEENPFSSVVFFRLIWGGRER